MGKKRRRPNRRRAAGSLPPSCLRELWSGKRHWFLASLQPQGDLPWAVPLVLSVLRPQDFLWVLPVPGRPDVCVVLIVPREAHPCRALLRTLGTHQVDLDRYEEVLVAARQPLLACVANQAEADLIVSTIRSAVVGA